MLAIWSGWSVVAAAGGTLAAIATIALVIVTWMLVDRTQAMARTAHRQLAASSEPLLVDVEHNSARTGEHDYEIEYDDGGTSTIDQSWVAVYSAPSEGVLVSFPLRNVGSGVAVVSGAALKVGDQTFAGRVVRRFIAPGELGRFEWQWATAGPNAAAIRAAISAGVLAVAVEYADFGGRRSTAAHCTLRARTDGSFRVHDLGHDVASTDDALDRPAWALTLQSFSLSLLGARIHVERTPVEAKAR